MTSKEDLKKETLGCIIRKTYKKENAHGVPYCTLYYVSSQRQPYVCPYQLDKKTQSETKAGILQDYWRCNIDEQEIKERKNMYDFLKNMEESWEEL